MRLTDLSQLTESDEDDPFADPNPTDLKMYLAKLRFKLSRANHFYSMFDREFEEINNILVATTGEPYAFGTCRYGKQTLRSGWTLFGKWQVSPAAMAEPSLRYVIDKIRAAAHLSVSADNLKRTINHVKRQIKLAKDAQKSKPL